MSTGGKLMLAILVFAILAVFLAIKVNLGLGITVGVLGVVGASLVGALAGTGPKFDERAVMANGIAAGATITDVQDMGVTMNNSIFLVRLVLRVEPDGMAPFESSVKTSVSRVKIPQVGSKVAIKYDPSIPTNVVLAGDAFTPPQA